MRYALIFEKQLRFEIRKWRNYIKKDGNEFKNWEKYAHLEFKTHYYTQKHCGFNFRGHIITASIKNYFYKKLNYRQKNWTKNGYLNAAICQKTLLTVEKSLTERST